MDGLRRVLVGDAPTVVAARDDRLHPVEASLAELLAAGCERPAAAESAALDCPPLTAPADPLAPVDEQEVWASGSRTAARRARGSTNRRRRTSTSSSTRPSDPSSS
jgi:hypothetical protein